MRHESFVGRKICVHNYVTHSFRTNAPTLDHMHEYGKVSAARSAFVCVVCDGEIVVSVVYI